MKTTSPKPLEALSDAQVDESVITLIGGTLLIVISFFSSYSHVDIPQLSQAIAAVLEGLG